MVNFSCVRTTLAIVCFVAALHHAASDCCGRERARNGKYEPVCNDCTDGSPCCGIGHCNIFCCGCEDGCRVPDVESTGNCPARQRRGIPPMPMPYHHFPIFHHNESDVHSILRFADYDGNGHLDFGEADYYLRHLKKANHYTGYEDLHALDKNNDRFLSIDEIDPEKELVVDTDIPEPDEHPEGSLETEVPDGSNIGIGEAHQEGDPRGETQGQVEDTSEGVHQGDLIEGGRQGEEVVPTEDAELSQGEEVVPTGDAGLSQGEEVVPTGDAGLSQGEEVVPTGDAGLSRGEEVVPTGDAGLSQGEEVVPTEDAILSRGEDESIEQSQSEDEREIDIDTRIANSTKLETDSSTPVDLLQ